MADQKAAGQPRDGTILSRDYFYSNTTTRAVASSYLPLDRETTLSARSICATKQTQEARHGKRWGRVTGVRDRTFELYSCCCYGTRSLTAAGCCLWRQQNDVAGGGAMSGNQCSALNKGWGEGGGSEHNKAPSSDDAAAAAVVCIIHTMRTDKFTMLIEEHVRQKTPRSFIPRCWRISQQAHPLGARAFVKCSTPLCPHKCCGPFRLDTYQYTNGAYKLLVQQ